MWFHHPDPLWPGSRCQPIGNNHHVSRIQDARVETRQGWKGHHYGPGKHGGQIESTSYTAYTNGARVAQAAAYFGSCPAGHYAFAVAYGAYYRNGTRPVGGEWEDSYVKKLIKC